MDLKAGLKGNLYVPVCLSYLFMTDLNLQDGILSNDMPSQCDVCLKIGHCQRTGRITYKVRNYKPLEYNTIPCLLHL